MQFGRTVLLRLACIKRNEEQNVVELFKVSQRLAKSQKVINGQIDLSKFLNIEHEFGTFPFPLQTCIKVKVHLVKILFARVQFYISVIIS